MNHKILTTTLALLALAGHSAFAQSTKSTDGTAYVGLAGGVSHFSGACDDGAHCDRNRPAIKIYGGYTIADDISAEITYYELGTLKETETVGTTDVTARLRGAYWGLGGAWRPELGNGWGAVVRAGAAYSQGKLSGSAGTFSVSEKRTSWQPYAGIGATYALTKDIKLEADYDFTRVGAQLTDPTTHARDRYSNSVNNFMLGATYRF